jgi:antitoxin YefM
MGATSYASARANLAATLERVCSDHDPLIITRTQAPSVVMVSKVSGGDMLIAQLRFHC